MTTAVAPSSTATRDTTSVRSAAPTTMKAFRQHRYGAPDAVQLETVDRPTVGDGDVLVRVRASSVNSLDVRVMSGYPLAMRFLTGLRRPSSSAVGTDLSGVVEAVGKDVTRFTAGDEVFGVCDGAFAEYVCAKQDKLAPKPAALTFEQAATIPIAALTALQALRDAGKLRPAQKVLINGSSGGVGTFAVQIAKALGADVTAVCSTRSVDLVRSLGADRVIDRQREDLTREGTKYDLLINVAVDRPLRVLARALRPDGTLVIVGGTHGRILGPMVGMFITPNVVKWSMSQKLVPLIASIRPDDLVLVGTMIADGKVRPVIDRTYAFAETRQALAHLLEGRAQGKVVITI